MGEKLTLPLFAHKLRGIGDHSAIEKEAEMQEKMKQFEGPAITTYRRDELEVPRVFALGSNSDPD